MPSDGGIGEKDYKRVWAHPVTTKGFPLYLRLKTDKDGCILASFDAKIEPILWLLQSRGVCYFQYPALQPKLQEYQLQASLAQVCPSYISYHFVFRASPRTLYK